MCLAFVFMFLLEAGNRCFNNHAGNRCSSSCSSIPACSHFACLYEVNVIFDVEL